MNLILLPEGTGDGLSTVTGAQARHLFQVLRARPGQVVRVGVLNGGQGVGTVRAVERDAAVLDCTFGAPPAPPGVDLLLALPRPKVLQRLWAQCAALGVRRILLTNAWRVERAYFDTHVLDPAVYTPRLHEGLQQARDTWVPLVTVHRQFRALIEDDLDGMAGAACRLLADPGPGHTVGAAVRGATPARVLLAVGPEGGWNDFERGLLQRHGFVSVSAGPRTLRTDTACVALLTLVHEALHGAG